jgi:menaquinone-9 beta-reductase
MHSASTLYDVAIVGAGPAGTAVAIALAHGGWRVVVVDRATFPRDKPCAEYLSPAAEPLLRDLGVLDAIEAMRPGRPRGFRIFTPNGSVFQGDFSGTRDAAGRPFFERALAVPRFTLDATMVEGARRAGAEVREGWSLSRIERDRAGLWTLTPASGQVVRARLLVAADGIHSTVARRLGLHARGRLRKIALVAHLRGVAGMDAYGEMHVAGRRYVGLALLESDGDLCNAAMVVDAARDGRGLAGRAEAFLLETLETFPGLRGRLAGAHVVRRTLTASGLHMRTRRLSGEGILLVGDAAGYYDPFTGEGIYRGLRSARLAATVAARALATGDVSAIRLARYDALYRQQFRGTRQVEQLIQAAVQVPALMDHAGARLARRAGMADTLMAVTGDFLSPSAVLNPAFLLRLAL